MCVKNYFPSRPASIFKKVLYALLPDTHLFLPFLFENVFSSLKKKKKTTNTESFSMFTAKIKRSQKKKFELTDIYVTDKSLRQTL